MSRTNNKKNKSPGVRLPQPSGEVPVQVLVEVISSTYPDVIRYITEQAGRSILAAGLLVLNKQFGFDEERGDKWIEQTLLVAEELLSGEADRIGRVKQQLQMAGMAPVKGPLSPM